MKKIVAFLIIGILTLSLIPITTLAFESYEGSGTSDDPYLIKTADDFVYLLNNPNTNAYYKLANDIDMTEKNWTVGTCEIPDYIAKYHVPGSQFNGTLDGNGKTISNISKTILVTDTDNHDLLGLFGTIGESGCVKNLTISNLNLKGTNNVGTIAALNMGTITNCMIINSKIISDEISRTSTTPRENETAFSGNMSGAGGIAGFNLGSIKNCSVELFTNDRGGPNSGGICGYNQGIISACETKNLNIISVETRLKEYIGGRYGGNAGGIAGHNSTNQIQHSPTHATIENCTNYSDIIYFSSGGGICGWNVNATIKDCINYGNIKIAPPIEGTIFKPGARVGGISGDICQNMIGQETQIIHCANYGDVEGTHDVGGITGRADNMAAGDNLLLISNCLNQGNVVGNNRVAGIIGKSDATITSCFNTGNVTQKGEYNGRNEYYIGGVVALSYNGIDFCGNSGIVSSEITTGVIGKFAVIGGIAGRAFNSPVKHSYNIAPVLCALSKEKREKKGILLGGIVGDIVNGSLIDNYFANDVQTDAELSDGSDTMSDKGISAAKMFGLQAKKNMPGLFGEGSPFEVCDNFEMDGVVYTTAPYISGAFMDKTTFAIVDHIVPVTGNNNLYVLWIVLIILSMAAVVLTSKKIFGTCSERNDILK